MIIPILGISTPPGGDLSLLEREELGLTQHLRCLSGGCYFRRTGRQGRIDRWE